MRKKNRNRLIGKGVGQEPKSKRIMGPMIDTPCRRNLRRLRPFLGKKNGRQLRKFGDRSQQKNIFFSFFFYFL